MYDKYTAEIQFRDKLFGGLPKNREIIENYVNAKFGEQNADLADKIAGEVQANEAIERITTGFKCDEKGLYISDYQVKAMLKQAANLLNMTVAQNKGGKGYRGKEVLKEGTYVKPVRIHLGHAEVDGSDDFFGHIEDWRTGSRSVLRRGEYVEKAKVSLEIWTLARGLIRFSGDEIREMLEFGQELGLGSYRSFERGKFDVVSFKPV